MDWQPEKFGRRYKHNSPIHWDKYGMVFDSWLPVAREIFLAWNNDKK